MGFVFILLGAEALLIPISVVELAVEPNSRARDGRGAGRDVGDCGGGWGEYLAIHSGSFLQAVGVYLCGAGV